MIAIQEIGFKHRCPPIRTILKRVGQRTGSQLVYFPQTWLLTNPANKADCLNLYRESGNTIVLIYEETASTLVETTICALVEMGGKQTDFN